MFEAWGHALYRGRRWAPRPLRRLYARYGIAEEDDGPAGATGTIPVPAARGQ
jgi:hypothetical protein